MATSPDFTPALGRHELTGQYDRVIALMTRESRWRSRLLAVIDPKAGETVVDLGAGTGSLAVLVKARAPDCRVIAVDPDPAALEIARAKAAAAGRDIEFVEALGEAQVLSPEVADTVVSSLVLHQCSTAAKAGLLRNAHRLLRSGGRLWIADYGLQRTALMSLLFRQVRALDGYENTRANKDGEIPAMMADAGFGEVVERSVTATPTGSISIYGGVKIGA